MALFSPVISKLFPYIPLQHLPLLTQDLLLMETGYAKCQKTVTRTSFHFTDSLTSYKYPGPFTLL